jgi:hypothetical protein
MGMEQLQNGDQQGKNKVVGEKPVPLPLHPLRITLEVMNPRMCREKTISNRLSHDTDQHII